LGVDGAEPVVSGKGGDIGVLVGFVGFGFDGELVEREVWVLFGFGVLEVGFDFFEFVFGFFVIEMGLVLRQEDLEDFYKLFMLFKILVGGVVVLSHEKSHPNVILDFFFGVDPVVIDLLIRFELGKLQFLVVPFALFAGGV
jgi:hypothetical protein